MLKNTVSQHQLNIVNQISCTPPFVLFYPVGNTTVYIYMCELYSTILDRQIGDKTDDQIYLLQVTTNIL